MFPNIITAGKLRSWLKSEDLDIVLIHIFCGTCEGLMHFSDAFTELLTRNSSAELFLITREILSNDEILNFFICITSIDVISVYLQILAAKLDWAIIFWLILLHELVSPIYVYS